MFLTSLLLCWTSATRHPRTERLCRVARRRPATRRNCFEQLDERTLLSGYTNFTPIWDSNSHGAHAPALNASGAVAFAWHPSVRDTVVVTGDETGLRDRFQCLFCNLGLASPAVSDTEDTAFFASGFIGAEMHTGIFRADEGGVTIIAADDPDGPFIDFGALGEAAPGLNGAGTVAFFADLSAGGSGLFLGDGATTRPVVTTGNLFSDLGSAPALNSHEAMAFRAELTLTGGQTGLFLAQGGWVTDIALSGDDFSAFGAAPSLNEAGAVAFYATLTTGARGVFLWDGTTATPVALSGERWMDFDPAPSLNNQGDVAFLAQRPDGGSHLVAVVAGQAIPVIATGDSLFGSTVTRLAFFRQGLNDADQVAFWADLADGHNYIVRADYAPDPGAAAPRLGSAFIGLLPGAVALAPTPGVYASGSTAPAAVSDAAEHRPQPPLTADVGFLEGVLGNPCPAGLGTFPQALRPPVASAAGLWESPLMKADPWLALCRELSWV
jgi:hypothetical protein